MHRGANAQSKVYGRNQVDEERISKMNLGMAIVVSRHNLVYNKRNGAISVVSKNDPAFDARRDTLLEMLQCIVSTTIQTQIGGGS